MTPQEFKTRSLEADRLLQSGDATGALRRLEDLAVADLPAADRAVTCVNAALACDRLGRRDDALRWHDRAIECAASAGNSWHIEQKALYLAKIGRFEEARALCESLLGRGELPAAERDRIRGNLASLRQADASPAAADAVRMALDAAHVPAALEIRGTGRGALPAGAVLLAADAAAWSVLRLPGMPGAGWPPHVIHGGAAVLALVAVILIVTGLASVRRRLAIDAGHLRHETIWRTRDVPLASITDVSEDAELSGSGDMATLRAVLVFWAGDRKALSFPCSSFAGAGLAFVLRALLRRRPEVRVDKPVRARFGLE